MTIETIAGLPAHVHGERHSGIVVANGSPASSVILWTDRTRDQCATCHEPVDRVPACPAELNLGAQVPDGGQVNARDLTCQCGAWLDVAWYEVRADADVAAAAARLADQYAAEITERREAIRESLAVEVAEAVSATAGMVDGDALDDAREQLTTGSDTEPGRYWDGEHWTAWDYDPDGSGDPITVDERGADVK